MDELLKNKQFWLLLWALPGPKNVQNWTKLLDWTLPHFFNVLSRVMISPFRLTEKPNPFNGQTPINTWPCLLIFPSLPLDTATATSNPHPHPVLLSPRVRRSNLLPQSSYSPPPLTPRSTVYSRPPPLPVQFSPLLQRRYPVIIGNARERDPKTKREKKESRDVFWERERQIWWFAGESNSRYDLGAHASATRPS